MRTAPGQVQPAQDDARQSVRQLAVHKQYGGQVSSLSVARHGASWRRYGMRLRTAAAGPDLFPLFLHTIWALPWCPGKEKKKDAAADDGQSISTRLG